MRKNLLTMSIGVAMSVAFGLPAHASPSCLKEKEPFALSTDTVKWLMTIAPGAECIQGLRWSYMQIFEVAIISGPSKGRLAMVGSGFRYFANPNDRGVDKFTLLILGKNRHDLGKSTLEVEVHSGSNEAGGSSRNRVASTQAFAAEVPE